MKLSESSRRRLGAAQQPLSNTARQQTQHLPLSSLTCSGFGNELENLNPAGPNRIAKLSLLAWRRSRVWMALLNQRRKFLATDETLIDADVGRSNDWAYL